MAPERCTASPGDLPQTTLHSPPSSHERSLPDVVSGGVNAAHDDGQIASDGVNACDDGVNDVIRGRYESNPILGKVRD